MILFLFVVGSPSLCFLKEDDFFLRHGSFRRKIFNFAEKLGVHQNFKT